MRIALINPQWSFGGSTYFGCREAHYPLELLYARDQIRERGDDVLLLDAHNDQVSLAEARDRVRAFAPDFLVIPTAPSYLFWRCPPPELRVPRQWFSGLESNATRVAIGPHGSATPSAVMRKTGCDVVLRGEPDQTLAQLAHDPWDEIAGCCYGSHRSAARGAAEMAALGPTDFTGYNVEARAHRHHVFQGEGRGAELEFARGCPWSCTFCNKTLFRDRYRERNVEDVLAEIDSLIARGVDYIYFIDEVFGIGTNVRRLLAAIAERNIHIGLQTRIDLWDEDSLDLLARAGCISMECGVESVTHAGREALNKNCRIDDQRISGLLIYARRRIPWVQANLVLTPFDQRDQIRAWQARLKQENVWVSEPVPMYPYPGSPLYEQTFGAPPDDQAWERAHRHYTANYHAGDFSDIQEERPLPLEELECAC